MDYYNCLNKKIRYLKANNPKDYWNLLNKSTEGKKEYAKIATEAFLDHFKSLNQNHQTSDNATTQADSKLDPPISRNNHKLNDEFTPEELSKIIKKLKNNKSSGLDFIINEFLKKLPRYADKIYGRFF